MAIRTNSLPATQGKSQLSYLDTTPSYMRAGEVYRAIVKAFDLVWRKEQADMIADIIRCLIDHRIGLLESTMGTGKTLAKLIAAMFVIEKTGDPVVIATTRIDLQMQMFKEFEEKVLPFFPDAKVSIFKGKRNYISVAKLNKLEEKFETSDANKAAFREFKACVTSAEICGDIERCLGPYEKIRPIMEQLGLVIDHLRLPSSASDEEDQGFYLQALKNAQAADLLIVNHALLAVFARRNFSVQKSDILNKLRFLQERVEREPDNDKYLKAFQKFRVAVSRGADEATLEVLYRDLKPLGLQFKKVLRSLNSGSEELPFNFSNILIDEAHQFVENVRTFLSDTLAFSTAVFALKDLAKMVSEQKKKDPWQEVVVRVAHAASMEINNRADRMSAFYAKNEITNQFNMTSSAFSPRYSQVFSKTIKDVGRMNELIDTTLAKVSKYKKHLNIYSRNAYDNLMDVSLSLKNIVSYSDKLESNRGKKGQVKYNLSDSDFYITFSKIERNPSFELIRKDISGWLYDVLWTKIRGAALVSGTIADANSFANDGEINPSYYWIKKTTGLIYFGMNGNKFLEVIYPKPFIWDKINVFIHKDSPLNSVDDTDDFSREFRMKHIQFCADKIIEELSPKKGGALILCPSYEDVEMLYSGIKDVLSVNIIAQGVTHKSIQSCINAYLAAPKRSIFISTGAWYGLDLAGELLTNLFILRIPWMNFDSPQYLARRTEKVDEITGKKKIYGHELTVTEVFNKFRQGVGRLPRGEHDRGNIHIFDARILGESKTYKSFYNFLSSNFVKVRVI